MDFAVLVLMCSAAVPLQDVIMQVLGAVSYEFMSESLTTRIRDACLIQTPKELISGSQKPLSFLSRPETRGL